VGKLLLFIVSSAQTHQQAHAQHRRQHPQPQLAPVEGLARAWPGTGGFALGLAALHAAAASVSGRGRAAGPRRLER
jgi:hypothetical protein